MTVIVGLTAFAAFAIVGVTGLMDNARPTRQLAEPFSVLGHRLTGSIALFAFGTTCAPQGCGDGGAT